MSGQQFKSKIKENAIAYAIIALLSSGSGSAVTAIRGPSTDEIAEIKNDVQEVKIELARMSQKLDDFIEHSRERVKLSANK
jgi:hypothetical protein